MQTRRLWRRLHQEDTGLQLTGLTLQKQRTGRKHCFSWQGSTTLIGRVQRRTRNICVVNKFVELFRCNVHLVLCIFFFSFFQINAFSFPVGLLNVVATLHNSKQFTFYCWMVIWVHIISLALHMEFQIDGVFETGSMLPKFSSLNIVFYKDILISEVID